MKIFQTWPAQKLGGLGLNRLVPRRPVAAFNRSKRLSGSLCGKDFAPIVQRHRRSPSGFPEQPLQTHGTLSRALRLHILNLVTNSATGFFSFRVLFFFCLSTVVFHWVMESARNCGSNRISLNANQIPQLLVVSCAQYLWHRFNQPPFCVGRVIEGYCQGFDFADSGSCSTLQRSGFENILGDCFLNLGFRYFGLKNTRFWYCYFLVFWSFGLGKSYLVVILACEDCHRESGSPGTDRDGILSTLYSLMTLDNQVEGKKVTLICGRHCISLLFSIFPKACKLSNFIHTSSRCNATKMQWLIMSISLKVDFPRYHTE